MGEVNGRRTYWTDELVAGLVRMRTEQHLPLTLCAERLGLSEGVVRIKARELRLNGRMNSGNRAAWQNEN